ncbi:TetR/AcrR family transcriptional regulator [Wenxinia marina]|nr:TetR/AcrR family transcriptional regulator [Wenxinia marina]
MTSPAPRPSRKRAAILAAAEAAFMEAGFTEAGMDGIAARAGASKQTVYAHFGSKEALFVAVADAMIARAVAAQAQAAPDPGPGELPATFLLAHAMQQLQTARDPRLMRLRRLATAETERFPALGRAVLSAGAGSSIARLERAFAMWAASGHLSAPDPARAARLFNWMLMGGPTSEAMLLGRAESVAADEDARAHAQECVRVFLAAYGPSAEPAPAPAPADRS